jgi:hypothetical protein
MRQGKQERGVFRHQSNQLRMGRFKIIHGVFEFAQKIPDRLRLLLAASGFVRRSFDQTGNTSPTFDHD